MVKAAVMADATSHVSDATCTLGEDGDATVLMAVVPRIVLVKNVNMDGMAMVETRPPTLMMVDRGSVSGLWNLR